MRKLYRGRLLLSSCLSGAALAWTPGALAQEADSNWQPRAEVDARAADGTSQVSFELFAPVAQNESNLMFVSGRIGYDEQFDRNGSVTIGGRGKVGDDFAIGVNAGIDFYKSDLSGRDQAAVSFGLEGFTSVFDVRLNYRLPVTNRSTIGYLDPNASPVGVLLVENNRLIERKSGWRLEDVPLGGANAEIGARIPLGTNLSVRASAAGFDYRDDAASKAYRGVRGGLELGVEDPLGSGGRFSIGAELQNDNRWGTQARGTLRLSIPLGRGSRDRGAGNSGLDRQMGDRVRRDYVTPSGTHFTDLTSNSFAIDARTGNEFGGIYYVNGAAAAAGAGTSASPTTLADAVTRAGANGVVVAMGNAGSITTGGVTLATNQYLVGGASSVDVRHSNGTVSAFSFGSTNGTIVGSNAGGAAVTLGQGSIVRDVTVRGSGSGILANGVGGFGLQRVTIENTGGAGLTLANTTGTVVIDGITIRGGAGAGLIVNGGNGLVLRNSVIGGGAGAIDINDAGGNLTASLANLSLSATGGTVLDIDGSGTGTVQIAGLSGIFVAGGNGETGGFAARNVTFDSSTAAGIQAVNAGTMQVGTTTARVNGAAVTLTDVDGALSFGSLNIANNGGTGLTVNNTKTGTFTLTGGAGAVDTTAGTALNLDPLLINLNFATVSSTGAAGAGIILDNVQGAGTGGSALNIGTLTIANSGQQGLFITGGSTGLVTIGGGTITNSGGASVQVGEAGVAGSGGTIGLDFGATITDSGAGPLASIFNAGGALRFTGAIGGAGPITIDGTAAGSSILFAGNVAISGSAGTAVSINNVAGTVGFTGTLGIANPSGSGILIGNSAAGSTVAFTGATTITGAGAPALSLDNLAGATGFTGTLSIVNPTGTAITIGAVPGGVSFGDVDITGLGAATGLDLTGTSGNVTFGTLDITGTGAAGSTGIDLTNAANAGAVIIANPSVIQGVDIGANLTNAHITGSFRLGDGNAADGLESRITANTVIAVLGLNAAQGTYDFADVQLDGDTNNITGGSFTTYYVLAGATGTGTATDPGSIAGAAASGAQYIVLLNDPNGGQDVIDTAGLTGGALSLTAGQSLVSFLNTDFFAVTGATVPANLIVSNLGPTGIANTFAGSGAAILTSNLGASTVNLASNTRIDGVVIDNDALGIGVVGSGVSNVIIRNSIISGNGGAISISDGGAAASVTLTNLELSASGGRALALSGAGAGALNVSGTGINIAATGAASAVGLTDVTVGALDIGSVTTEFPVSNGVMFNQVAGGTVNVGSVTTFGTTLPTGTALAVVNSGATVNIGAVDITNTAGTAVTLLNNSGNVTLGSVSVINSAGTVAGVNISGNTGNVTLGPVLVDSGAGDGVRLNGNGGTVSLGQLTVRNVAGAGLRVAGATGATTVAGAAINFANNGIAIANVSGSLSIGNTEIRNNAGTGIQIGGVTGSASFTGTTTISGGNGIVLGAGSTGTISFGDVDITGLGANRTGLDARAASGTVSFATLDISGISTTGTRGINMAGAAFAGNLTVAESSTITGVGTGIDLTNAAITGSFRYGDGSNTDADGANSAINAITPITVSGINEAVGSYNFADVVLNGDTTGLVTNPVRLFFVEQGRTGAGTKTDPGSLAAALASNATVIVLLNNPAGGNDTLDVTGLGTFALDANQRLIGFLNGDSQNVGGGTPVNMVLYGLTPGIVTNPYAGSGAGLLTNTTGGPTVTLANGASIDGIRIGGTGIGVSGIGVSNVSIANSIISGGNGAILLRDGGAAASATLTNLTLSGTGGTVLDLLGTNGGSLTLRGSGISIAATGNARGLAMDSVTLGANLGFGAVSTQTAAGAGVALNNVGGAGGLSFSSINVGGTTSQSGVRVTGNSAAIGLGNVTVANTANRGVEIANNPGNVTLGTFTINNTGSSGLLVSGMAGSFTAAGGTVTNSGAAGIAIGDIDGSATFTGGVTIANPGAAGIAFDTGSTGTINFADVDVTGLGANRSGVDARLASGNITFGTLDITGASAAGTRGIDLTGAAFAGNLIVAGSSTITGVGTGVDLSNAAITGNFRFGDGSNTDANGAASTINATIPLVVTGLNSAVGTYNFADVNLVGDTSSLATSATVYWVLAGASGAGTRGDPGSLAGAAASGADIIILVNNPAGGNDTLDANDATFGTGGTFTLMTGQQLRGFLNGDTIALPGGAPANVVLYNVATGSVTNPFAGSGAPTLTTTAGGGAHTVVVADNAVIDGVVIANGGTGAGVFGSGKSNVTIRNSNISGANGAINFSSGGLNASLALSGLNLRASNNSNALAAYVAGGGSTTITQLTSVMIEGGHGEQGGAYFAGATFDSDLATAGYQAVDAALQVGTGGTRVTGLGVELGNAIGALNFTSLGIFNQNATGLHLTGSTLNLTSSSGTVDTIGGTTLALSGAQTDLVLDGIVHAGTGSGIAVTGLTGIGTGGRALQVGALNVTSASANGISIAGNVDGRISFGAGSSIAGTAGSAISISSGTGTLAFSYNGSVIQGSNAALLDVAGHNGSITFGGTSNLSATNGTGLQFSNADGFYGFGGTTSLNGGDAGIDILAGSDGIFTFAANTTIANPTGTAVTVDSSNANVTYMGSISHSAAGTHAISAVNHAGSLAFQLATLNLTGGNGLSFSNADGSYLFGNATLTGGAGIAISNGSAGNFTFFSGTSVTNAAVTGFSVANSTARVTYSGSLSQANGTALSVTAHSGWPIDFSAATINATGGTGLSFNDADGSYQFNNVTLTGGAGIAITNGSAGSFGFGSGTSITNAAGAAISVANSTGSLAYSGSINHSSAGAAAIDVSGHSAGTLSFSGATIAATGGTGLAFSDADGTYNFGHIALSGGSRLAFLGGSAGTFTFGNVDITGLAANTTAVDLTGATGNVSFNTLDIAAASATGTRGIDMTGSTTGGNVIVNGSSSMTGLGIGVDLTNAAITGNFRYGDGSNTDANGAASSIAAVTPLVIAGLNGGVGNYNFADVNMVGDTTNLSVSAYFVLDGATGSGTRSDPGSLAGAEAANATYIVLLNNPTGGNDILDATAGAGGSFDLDGGQILFSFRDTDSFIVGGGAPANVVLYNVQTGVISNPFAGSGAPTLTASGANATLTLGGGNIIDGVVIANSGTGAGILGNGAGGTLTIRNSTVSGGAAGALRIFDNAANVVLGLSNLTLAANGGNILNLDGTGAGTFTLTQLANLNVTHTAETGGFVFSDVTFDSDTVAAGLQAVSAGALTLGTTGARITGDGLSLTNVTGTLNFTNLNIANNGGTGLIVANSKANNFVLGTTGGAIDTINGTAINLDPLSIDMVLDSVSASGGAYGILLDQVLGSFTVTGAVNVTGATNAAIAVRDNTALGVRFQGAVAVNNTTGAGLSLTNNNGATVDFAGGLGITTTTGTGFAASGGGTISVTGSGNTITTGSGGALALNGVTVAAGGITFDQITAAPTLATAVSAVNTNLTGALNIRGLDLDSANAAVVFNNLTGAGGVNLTGTLDIDSGIGFTFAGTLGTINVANTAGSLLTIDGAQQAIRFINVTGGTVNIASAAGSAAVNGSINSAIGFNGDTGGTLNYGGTINSAQGEILTALNSAANVTLSGAITSTTAATAFNFLNADGAYTISGTVGHTGGAGVAVNAASAGSITFSGASKSFNTGTSAAITTAGTGSLSFTGGGLGIVTTTGTGFTASGGGTVLVHGAGNTIAAGNATALSLNGVTLAAGGVDFQSISATPTAATAVIANALNMGGTLGIHGLTVSGGGTGASFSNLTGGSGVILDGTIDIDGGVGLDFSGTLGTISIAGGAGSMLSIDGALTAIRFNGVTSGNVNIGLSGGSASIGATTSSATAAIGVNGGTGGLLSYGGTIRATMGAALGVANSASLVDLSGAITSTTASPLFSFVDAAGTYNISGAVSHSGGTGVVVGGGSTGAITFSNASKVFNTGNSTAISKSGTATLSFTGGGLDIDTTAGIGFTATGGTVAVTGANNRIDTVSGQVLSLNGVTAGSGGINFASLTATGSGAGHGIFLNDLVGNAFNGGTVNIAGIGGVASDGILVSGGTAAITFGATTIGAAGSNAIELLNSGSAVTFGTLNLAGAGGNTVMIGGSTGTVTMGTGTINATGAANYAVGITGGTGDIGILAALGGTNMVSIDNHETGTVTFGGNMSSTVNGISIVNSNSGVINFTGPSLALGGTGTGVFLDGNTGGTIDFNPAAGGNGLDIVTTGAGFTAINGGTVVVRGAGNSISTTGTGTALNLQGVTIGLDGFTFAGVSVSGATTGIAMNGVGTTGAALSLGAVNLQGITARGIDITGNNAVGLSITDLDIALNSNSAVALDLNGATLSAPIIIGDFDVTNAGAAGTSIGVDLRGTLGGASILLGGQSGASSSIAGVGTGIYLNAATNALFAYGDGEAVADTGSTVSASTAIDATNAPAVGTYDFRDVAFSGSPGAGFGLNKIYFVDSNGATGGGNGSGADGSNPMTLAAAEQLASAQDMIVLINNGSAISAAGSNGNDSLLLASNVQVRGFGNGVGSGAGSGSAPIVIALTVPSTILLSGGTSVSIADPTGNGAATLTSAAGANLITLGATGNHLSGFILDGTGGVARGVKDNGAGAANTLLDHLTIRNFATQGIEITPSTSTTIDFVDFSGNGSDVLLNAANSVLSNITSFGGGITLDNATGTTTLTNLNLTGGSGLSFANAAGTINGTNIDVTNPSGAALTISGGTAAFNFDSTSSIVKANAGAALSIGGGHATGAFAYAGTINATNGTGLQFDNADGIYSFTGTTTLNGGDAGIDIVNGSTGSFGFGANTAITHAAAGDAFVLTDSNAGLTYSGSITDSNGYAVRIDNHDAATMTFDTGTISSSGANALGLSVTNSNGGAINFNGQTTLSTQANNAITLSGNAGGTIGFAPDAGNDLDITTTSGTALAISGGGIINVLGSSNTIATGSGTLLDIANTTAVTSTLNLNFAAASNTLGATGILINRTAGTLNGSVNIGAGAITATNRGVDIDGGALSLTYGGSIATSGTTARSVEVTNITGGSNTFNGNLTDTALGINVANNAGGQVNFFGQSIALNTVANANAVTLTSNTGTSITFSSAAGGNGFDIVASGTGKGIDFTGGGFLMVYGAGSSIQTANGQILNLVNGNVNSALGLVFDSLISTGSTNGSAINISNVDGGTLTVNNTVSIAGTTGATADGIFYGGGSTMNVNLGPVTIANTGDEGIEINGAGNGSFTASSVTINNTTGNGVEINGATNSVSLNGGAIGGTDDPTGYGVYVLNGTGAVTVSASITKTTAGNVVFVDNHETGTVNFAGNISATGALANGIQVQNVNSGTVQFGGAVTLSTGANAAVNLVLNSGGTISFPNGGLGITTTSGFGFSATGGGTVDVRGTNSTITSGTGTALNIANTTIGASGVTFRSISSNGAASGIILNNTGSTGGLRVVGTGTAGSGGTINNSTGDGISLTDTQNVRLTFMNVTNNRGDGIGGSNVNGFVIDNLTITNNGNDNGTDESGINISELTGTGSGGARPTGIFNSTISNNNEFEVQITNSTGTLTNFQVVNSTISSNGNAVNSNPTPAHGNLFNFLGTGTSSMGLTVTGSTFTGNWNSASPPAVITGSGLFIDSSGTSMTANIGTSNFYNNNNGINVSTGPGSTTLTYSIIGNTITGSRSTAINDFQNGNSPFTRTVYGTIQNNVIGTNGTALSGSQLGNGISISNEGAVNATYLINGNTIQQIGQAGVSGSSAIAVNVGLVGQATGGGTTNLTITNNTIRDILNSRGIVINNNQNTGTLPTIRLSLSGNGFLGTIAGQAGNGQYIRLSASGGGQFFLTQAAATAGAIPSELDDANGFNDTTRISIGSGTITYNSAAPSQPPPVVPLP